MTANHLNDPALTTDENDDWQRFVKLLQLAFEQDLQHPILQLLLTLMNAQRLPPEYALFRS